MAETERNKMDFVLLHYTVFVVQNISDWKKLLELCISITLQYWGILHSYMLAYKGLLLPSNYYLSLENDTLGSMNILHDELFTWQAEDFSSQDHIYH